MKLIPLTQGVFTKVDDGDFEWLTRWKWCATKGSSGLYAIRRAGVHDDPPLGHRLWMHRVILGITDPKIFGDHKNHDKLDNQRNNLRPATKAQNGFNKIGRVRAFCAYKGVHLRTDISRKKPWLARIAMDGKDRYLGVYATPKEAAIAYDRGARELFGEFAFTNFSEEEPVHEEQTELLDAPNGRGQHGR